MYKPRFLGHIARLSPVALARRTDASKWVSLSGTYDFPSQTIHFVTRKHVSVGTSVSTAAHCKRVQSQVSELSLGLPSRGGATANQMAPRVGAAWECRRGSLSIRNSASISLDSSVGELPNSSFTAYSIYPCTPARLIFLNSLRNIISLLKFSCCFSLPTVIIKLKLVIQSHLQDLPLFHLGIFKLCNVSNILEITWNHLTNLFIQTTHIYQYYHSTCFLI